MGCSTEAEEKVRGVVGEGEGEGLHGLLRRLMAAIFFPASASPPTPLMRRFKSAVSDLAPLFPPAAQNTAAAVLAWVRAGSLFRALVVASVGMITLVALTGLLLTGLFFLAATANFIIICFLISLALLGGTVAFFIVCVTAVYIGVLSVATFVISAVAVSIIISVLTATGCVGFFWVAWMMWKKTILLGKQSLDMTSAMLSAYPARYDHHLHFDGKGSVAE